MLPTAVVLLVTAVVAFAVNFVAATGGHYVASGWVVLLSLLALLVVAAVAIVRRVRR